MKYQLAITFIKHTNLLDYLSNNLEACANKYSCDIHSVGDMEHLRSIYAKYRDVHLILFIRFENGRLFCKIKCPINPLPVTGEFQVPAITVLKRWLKTNGWCEHDTLQLNNLE